MTLCYGDCKYCLAWTRYGYGDDDSAGVCRRTPTATTKDQSEGCWMFLPSAEPLLEAAAPTLGNAHEREGTPSGAPADPYAVPAACTTGCDTRVRTHCSNHGIRRGGPACILMLWGTPAGEKEHS